MVETDDDNSTTRSLPALVAWGATRIPLLMEKQDRAETRQSAAYIEGVYREGIDTLDPEFAVMLRSPKQVLEELREFVRHGMAPPPVATWADTEERRRMTILEFVRCEFWITPDSNVVLLLDGQPSALWVDVRFPRSVQRLWPSLEAMATTVEVPGTLSQSTTAPVEVVAEGPPAEAAPASGVIAELRAQPSSGEGSCSQRGLGAMQLEVQALSDSMLAAHKRTRRADIIGRIAHAFSCGTRVATVLYDAAISRNLLIGKGGTGQDKRRDIDDGNRFLDDWAEKVKISGRN
jgi:hypothetical protein